MAEELIIIYGTSWFPDTDLARQCLNRNGISFIWCDIEKDQQGRIFVEKVNSGKRRVPTIVFPDGSILIEPSETELENKINLVKYS
jgi:mycoredoxin